MVHMPRLYSRVTSSITGSLFLTSMCLNISLSKPSFLANRYMISWSTLASNQGLNTFSRHCSERFEAVTEP